MGAPEEARRLVSPASAGAVTPPRWGGASVGRKRLRAHCLLPRVVRVAISWCLALLASTTAATAAPSSAARSPGQPAPPRVSVAVLPLQVHSAKSLDQLQRSIPELLQSRLVAAGRIDMVDPAIVKDAAARLRAEP